MTLREIRGKKANKVGWEALRLLDWEKDADVIEYIFKVTNGVFFSSRTPEEVVRQSRENVQFQKECDELMKIAEADLRQKGVLA